MFTPAFPDNPGDAYAYRELVRLADYINQSVQDRVKVKMLTSTPQKPREGDLVYADGTNWNPGAGPGLYQFRSGSWILIG